MYRQPKTSIKVARFGDGLTAKALRGGAWLGAGSVAEQTARFVRNLILVRLLAPSAFGTMAIVLSVSSVLGAFTEVGVREALVQSPRGTDHRYVEAAWWIAFGRAAATYIFLFVAAPGVARFYGNTELSLLLRVAVIGLLFEGAMSAKAYVALKSMNYSRWAGIVHGGGIIGVLTTVLLSFLIRDVWALVLGSCAESVARCVLSYVICPFLPTLHCDRSALKELLNFSRGLFGLSFLNLVFMRTDVFILAKLFPVAEVGLYTMAVYLIQVPAGFIINLVGQIVVPAFSQIQHDPARTNRIVIRTATIVASAALPALIFVCFNGQSLLRLIYGQPYTAAVTPFVVASWVALINVLNAPLTGVFYAAGRPELHRRCVAAMAIGMALLTYPLAKRFGPLGGQLACLMAISVGFGIQLERIRCVTSLNLKQYGRTLLLPAAVSSVTVLFCVGGRLLIPSAQHLLTISCGIGGCFLAYGMLVKMLSARVNAVRNGASNELSCAERLQDTFLAQ